MHALLSTLAQIPRGFGSIGPFRRVSHYAEVVRAIGARYGLAAPACIGFAFESPEMIAARMLALSAANGGE